MAHALLSPSSSHRWLQCPASVIVTKGLPDTRSEYAQEGTAAHHLAAECLIQEVSPDYFADRHIAVFDSGKCSFADEGYAVADMVQYVGEYIDLVQSIVRDTKGVLFVEQALPLAPITGEESTGTSDAVILTADEIIVVDLKYGQGVKVDAENNSQLMMYAAAAMIDFDYYGDFKTVRMIISQPRLNRVSEWTMPVPALQQWALDVAAKTDHIHELLEEGYTPKDFNPSDKACKFCKYAPDCKALADAVNATVIAEFDALDNNAELAERYASLQMVKDWCKSIEAAVFDRLADGQDVPGYKLVQGKASSRKWVDDAEAEATLKAMRVKVDDMYDRKLISPTTAEKLHKAEKLGKTQWDKLQSLITKSVGSPTVVPASDNRPAIQLDANEFNDLTQKAVGA